MTGVGVVQTPAENVVYHAIGSPVMVPLFHYSKYNILEENNDCVFEFHARGVLSHKELLVSEANGMVSVKLSAADWSSTHHRMDRLKASALRARRLPIISKLDEGIARARASGMKDDVRMLTMWKSGLVAGTDLYMSPDILMLEIFFSIPEMEGFENNFAAVVPIRREGDKMCVLPFYCGNAWEVSKSTDRRIRRKLCLTACTGTYTHDAGCAAIRAMFDTRDVMVLGLYLLTPFNTVVRRPPVTTGMLDQQNIYTYHFLHGIHSTECDTQVWMKRHTLPMQFVKNVLLRAFSRIGRGHVIVAGDNFTRDLLLQAIAFSIQETYLGHDTYRRDLCGEDIRTRMFDRVMKQGTPLFPGGDCEDLSQTFAQCVFTATQHPDSLLQDAELCRLYRPYIEELFTSKG